MILKDAILKSTDFLKKKEIPTARLDAELLLAFLMKKTRMQLYLEFDRPLTDQEKDQYREIIVKRGTGVPVAYLVRSKGFFKDDFFVDSRVLVPRPETELIVEYVLANISCSSDILPIADWGTGSGCIGLSIAKHAVPPVHVTLIDKEVGALEVTRLNADRMGISNIELILSDVKDLSGDERYQVITANPPYIDPADSDIQSSVKDFEPATALFANDGGMEQLKVWSKKAFQQLKSGGFFVMEHGSKQKNQVQKLFESIGYSKIEAHTDLARLDRFVVGWKA